MNTIFQHSLGRVFFLLLLLLGALLVWPAAHAQSKRMALVIGNAAYQGEKPLRNPGNDAADVAAALQRAGITVQRHTNLGRTDMNRAIDSFMAAAEGAELAVVYYSGHGMQAGGEAFLIPTDAKISSERDVRSEGIRLGELMDDLEGKRIRNTLLIIDACRDNPYRSRTKSATKGLARPKEMNGAFLVAYATADGTTADDGEGRNGAYTAELLKQLNQSSRKNLRDLMEDTQLAVEESTRGAQRPKTYGDSAKFRNVYLLASVVPERIPDRPAAPAAPAPLPTGPSAAEIEQQAWDAAKAANSEAGFRAYLGEYPQGRFASAARVTMASVRPIPPVQIASVVPEPRPQAAPSASQARPGSVIKDCADCPELVVIPAGRFMMGSNGGYADENPIHPVNIKQFAIGKTEVTQAQWQALMGSNPSEFTNCGPSCPVEKVSWDDVQQFIQKLNAKTGQSYRLPSESEWEYAARAGSQSKYSFGDSEGQLGQHAWYRENSARAWYNSERSTKPVAGKQANAFGLHDMHGNVSEWVEDCYHDTYSGAPTDGSAWTTNCKDNRRVLRGGSWNDFDPANLRSANRRRDTPDDRYGGTGFRLARTLLAP